VSLDPVRNRRERRGRPMPFHTFGDPPMLLTLTLLSALHAAPVADSIAGTWKITGDVAGNPLNQTCKIERTADSLSGNCAADGAPPTPISGSVKDGKITFKHGGDYQGTELTIIYVGTLASPTEMKGTIDVQPFNATGTFTATPAKR
jgi:hypothetical protein